MAKFLSYPGGPGTRATAGERRVADRLTEFLEDDYLCWYDVPVGSRNQHPDFVILHPRRGLLVLEVKDWKLDTLQEINPQSATLLLPTGLKTESNPLAQARAYAHAIVRILEADKQLTRPLGDAYQGKLSCPYGYGVVLTNITRHQFESKMLDEVLKPHLVICKDEMTESIDPEDFQERLWGMFNVRFESMLTLPQIERIRWHLFPELRIHQQSLLPGSDEASASKNSNELLQVMDQEQEAVARNLGEGHRVIHGVAGSGKTLILAYRCDLLAQTSTKPILVLVYNKSLAAWLEQHMAFRGLADRVTVRNFHRWCRDQLTHFHVPVPPGGPDFYAALVDAVIRAVDRGQIPRAQYGAVLIDEGHDFEADWLKLAVQMLDPESNSLLLLFDDAQSIYGKRRPASFTFRSVGISAVGRTRILKRNYRNTNEILTCAREFAHDLLTPKEADDDGIPSLHPEMGGRSGETPRFIQLASLDREAECVARQVQRFHEEGLSWKDIAIIYTTSFVAEKVEMALTRAGVPLVWLRDSQSKNFDISANSVKMMTPQSCKGLQFAAVIVAGTGFLPYRNEADDAKLMYVAMTRATHHLLLTSSKTSAFSERLRGLCAPL